ncbi:hypothetical protein [Salana multivorans]|nr:hypothetical protein [Salana multivorans]
MTQLPPGRDGAGGREFFASIEAAREAKAIADARARRSRLLRWSAPVVAILALAAVFLFAICIVVLVGERSYAAQSYTSAAGQFGVVRSVNAVETWKPHYNVGTAEYSSGRFFAATQDLGVALTLVPKAPEGEPPGRDECLVRINLSLSYEGLGDEAARATDAAMAISYYQQALDTVAGCGSGGGGGGSEQEQEAADQAEERQEEKQSEQQQEQQGGEGDSDGQGGQEPDEGEQGGEGDQQDGDTGEDEGDNGGQQGEEPTPTPTDGDGDQQGGEGEDGEPSETSTTSEQQQELEQRNQDAQEQREREQQEEGGGGGGQQGW